ncbi:hypothetical protein [Paenibacillus sp. HB172176]|uniref:hypothetical protein n=1 Tax=Paenibacillus sp. HB172176 TaxID=2493690 RepID=UPI00143AE73C|nr:hypothetical protein [Paenibacillus sp. HB172176]
MVYQCRRFLPLAASSVSDLEAGKLALARPGLEAIRLGLSLVIATAITATSSSTASIRRASGAFGSTAYDNYMEGLTFNAIHIDGGEFDAGPDETGAPLVYNVDPLLVRGEDGLIHLSSVSPTSLIQHSLFHHPNLIRVVLALQKLNRTL